VGGRRPDVDRLFSADSDGFVNIIRTYRDKYGIKIDYVMFDIGTTYSGVQNAALGKSPKARTQSWAEENQNIIFEFGENRENVVFNQSTGSVYLLTDEGQLNLAGYVMFKVRGGARLDFQSFGFIQDPDIQETLVVYLDEQDSVLLADLVELSAPISVKAFSSDFFGVNYLTDADPLQVVYSTSPDPWSWVKVCKINHVPSLVSPKDGTMTNESAITFEWTSAIDAVNYELWVDNDPDFTSPQSLENLPGFGRILSLPDDNYSWKVIAYDADNKIIGSSPVWTFVIDTTPPGVPELLTPADGATIEDNTPAFDWSDVDDAVKYELQVDNDLDFSSLELWDFVDVSGHEATLALPDDNYSWRVRAYDAVNNAGDFSPAWTFVVKTRGQENSKR
jgi:hypothetical protein